jgi:hypothetical protein
MLIDEGLLSERQRRKMLDTAIKIATTQELFDELTSRYDSIVVIHDQIKDDTKAKIYAKTVTECDCCAYELVEVLDMLHDGAVAVVQDCFEHIE